MIWQAWSKPEIFQKSVLSQNLLFLLNTCYFLFVDYKNEVLLSLTLSSDLRKANSTLDKTTKMRYNAQVHDCTLTAKAIGVSQE